MSQLQEPYSSVGYLCERVSFLSVLKLKHPKLLEGDCHQANQDGLSWTAWDVCEGKQFFFILVKGDSSPLEVCPEFVNLHYLKWKVIHRCPSVLREGGDKAALSCLYSRPSQLHAFNT